MTGALRHILAGLLVCLAPLPLTAQEALQQPPATLIADQIRFAQGSDRIVASGAVEIFFRGTRLRAQSVTYDGATDRVMVEGPLTLTEANGRTVVLAAFADLSADLRDGVLRSARIVFDRELQVASSAIDRSGGRYTQMYQAIASSCEVCNDNPVPIWEIRARRVVHDQLERQLYFEGAQFRAMGVPLAYIPRLRLPDPTLDRATGILTPSIRSNDELGTHLRLPYFIRIGDHADLTLTPWIGVGASRTVELRYRQAFHRGRIEVNGAISGDDLTQDAYRGYLFATGDFHLPRNYLLDFQIQGVSDRGYLSTYGFPDSDLLESRVRISRTERDLYMGVGASLFASQRLGDDNETLPTRVGAAEIIRRFAPAGIGGIATASLQAGGYMRPSDTAGPTGRDVARVTGALEWRRDTVLPGGLLLAMESALFADVYNTQQGAVLDGTETRVTPFGGVELRYPLRRVSARGVSHLIEPIAQLAWSETSGGPVPVEDSAIVEFDEANLFALDRFPGHDQREEGTRANLGIGYTRTDPLGWSLGIVGGLVLRDDPPPGQFTPGSGLDGTRSDWLLATHFRFDDRWRVVNRALFDDALQFTSNELGLGWQGDRHDLSTSYTWLEADAAEGRPRDMAEWAFDARYDFLNAWAAEVNWRYDFVEESATRAGLLVSYANECVDVALSVSRRYTASAAVTPATEFGLTVSLNGFGTNRSGRSHDRSCLR